MDAKLIESTSFSVNNHLSRNSIFLGRTSPNPLAERLYAFSPNEKTKNVLADCYLKANKHRLALDLLKVRSPLPSGFNRTRESLPISFVRLHSWTVLLVLNFSFADAEQALLGPRRLSGRELLENVPNGAPGLYLYGLISTYVQKLNMQES